MLDFHNVSVALGGRPILDEVSLRINERERVGIVGPNGAGKTTLFHLVVGDLAPDRGSIQVPRDVRIGHLRQKGVGASGDLTVLDFAEDALPAVREMQHEIETIEARLSEEDAGPAHDRDLRRLGELQSAFEHEGGYELRNRAAAALGGLGFQASELHRPLREFSGGWQMRAELTRALIARPDLLLLDEPTNYLDLPAVEWLQRHLRDFAGTLLLISHDRFLLNTLTSVTVDVTGGRVTRYEGNQAFAAKQRDLRWEQFEAGRAAAAKRREEIERFVDRFRFKASKAAQVQSRIKMLERMDPVEEAVAAPRAVEIRIAPPPPCGAEVMRIENAGVTYDGTRWVLRDITLRIMRGDKIALVGYNGFGKTTLLRLLAGRIEAGEGRRVPGHNVVPGYQSQEFAEILDPDRTVLETVKAAAPDRGERELRSLLGGFFFSGDTVEKKVRVLSGGETMRLAFARLLANPPNFLLLDEPTTHLDIAAREALERALADYQGTLCFVSHDVEFVRRVATTVIAMTPPFITPYAGGYDYYREKVAADAAAAGPAAAEGPATAPDGTDRKTGRRERALKREEVRKLRLPLLKAVREAEERIAALEKEQAELIARFDDPSLVDYAAVSRRLGEIRTELPLAMTEWESAGVKLQELDGN
ncbi:MAG: ABC-F family ATP-binding cassette domain-containing protein [Lentisphaerae bacterium]|nr:ABC-F family ATP-binding cassette domain-containing protein [Lentisphaerota bacterium]